MLAANFVVMRSAQEQNERVMGAEDQNGPKYFDANGDKSNIWPKTREKGRHRPNIWPQQDKKGQNRSDIKLMFEMANENEEKKTELSYRPVKL